MSVGQIKTTGVWYCQYRVAGKKSPVKEYFGKGTEGKKAAKLRDLEVRKAKIKKLPVNKSDMHLDELAQLYINHEKRKKRDKSYLSLISDKLNKEWLPILANKPIMQLKSKDFEEVHALYDGRAASTQNRYMDYLNIIFNYGVKMDHIPKNPMKKWWSLVKRPEKSRELTISLGEFRKLYNVSPPHLQFALEVMWELGARPGPSELFGLLWKDVDWQNNTIRVRGTKTEASDRVIPITDKFKERLKAKRVEAQTDFLIEFRGRRIKSVKTAFNSARKRAGLDKSVCMYTIRHLFTSEILAKGADAKAVANMLGHTSLRMIMNTYYHETNDERRRAIEVKPELI
ncbi:site-specific integrase [Pseudodesulfovibrio sp.]|uniref:tyrosine-type recombinase/integrase n=1 Tax=Pseudodesulfovibrio sp. TaxID=2035812 RepID=UPI002604E2CE|nr:site-specific integrase [Pseudodesulfovibrio sp.]MDD3311210.1 tyrosine-type recombinase/integrase [Pseudodesulfovibrio sp.]